jgi:hypothetical protein
MMRLLAAVGAAALFALVRSVTDVTAVALAGLIGLLLAAVAIAALRRWLATTAACVFLVVYAAALWIERAPVSVVSALAVGLTLVVFLEAVDLAARLQGATVQGGIVRSALGRWVGLWAGTLVTAMAATALATFLSTGLPAGAAPLLAAAGALGSVWVVAGLFRRAR